MSESEKHIKEKPYPRARRDTHTVRKEKYAWNVARDFVEKKQPKQLPTMRGMPNVLEKWAFGTYTGTTPPSMEGPNPKFYRKGRSEVIVKNPNYKATNVSMFSNPAPKKQKKKRSKKK